MIHRIDRRHVLKGVGSLISLPLLEAMIPAGAKASETTRPPVRLVWLFAGSGMFMPAYKPQLAGRNWDESREIPPDTALANGVTLAPEIRPLGTLQPLLPFKNDISILSGLLHQGAFTRGSVVRHGQDPMCHLTGVDLFRVPGVAVRNGVSVDQVAARHLGRSWQRQAGPCLERRPQRIPGRRPVCWQRQRLHHPNGRWFAPFQPRRRNRAD